MSLSESLATFDPSTAFAAIFGPVIAPSAMSSVFHGMRLLICFLACFLEIFFTLFFDTALLVAPGPAIAVPASAATSAMTATIRAGDGLRRVIRFMNPTPFQYALTPTTFACARRSCSAPVSIESRSLRTWRW